MSYRFIFILLSATFYVLALSFVVKGQVNLNSGLVAYYPFNGNANDAGPNGLNPSIVNNITYVQDQWGNQNAAAYFNGTSSSITIPNSSQWQVNNVTITCRIKPMGFYSGNCQGNVIFWKGGNFAAGHYGLLYSDAPFDNSNCSAFFPNNENFYGEISNNFPPAPSLLYTPHINLNNWYCLVFTFNGTQQKLFVNGVLAYTYNSSNPIGTNNDNIFIGFSGGIPGFPYWLNGALDEMRIYNRALNQQEVDSICNYAPPPPPISINKYASVESYDPCLNKITVDTTADFNVGDTILMIQMKGATIDTTNTSNFGNVLNYNSAGNYEYNTISAKNGNTLSLNYTVQRSYEIPNGKVQIVRVPFFQNYSVNVEHTCMPWNGSKGGVFAVNVANSFTLNNHINVDGKGFAGAAVQFSPQFSCNQANYYYPSTNNYGARKGEGIAMISNSKMFGRGCLANGGGGGNDHNAAGGGGSNSANGGLGGYQHQYGGCSTTINFDLGGIGGKGLIYNNVAKKIFLGGGGGAGHGNNGGQKDGANGGGIVVINASNIVGNLNSISASGASAPECGAPSNGCQDDGGGGGGAGGTVLINTNSITTGLNAVVKGGKGSNVFSSTPISQQYRYGPGGGGSGGVVWLNNPALKASMIIDSSGGSNGVLPQFFNDNFGAQTGQSGITLTNLILSFPIDTFKVLSYSNRDSFMSCGTYHFTSVRNSGRSAVQYSWNFGDGNSGTGNPVIHSYNNSGAYSVTLIVTDSLGCKDTVVKNVLVTKANAAFTMNKDTVCLGSSVLVTSTSTGTGTVQHAWDFGDGNTGGGNPVVHNYANFGSYSIRLIVSDSIGCIDTAYRNVIVGSAIGNFSLNKDSICLGEAIQITSNSSGSGALTHAWNFGDGNIGSINPITYNYINPGLYNITLVVTDAYGCKDTVSDDVYVGDVKADFQIGKDTVCIGQAVQFTNMSIGTSPLSYLWEFGDGNSTGQQSPSHIFNTPGVYTVTLMVNNQNPCFDSIKKQVYVVSGFSTSDEIYTCGDTSFVFGTQQITTTGVYSHTFITATGCDSIVTLTVALKQTPIVDFSFTPIAPVLNQPTQFKNTSFNTVKYLWDFGDGTSSTEKDPLHMFPATGSYKVCLTGWSSDGCKEILCKEVKADVLFTIDVPSGFSPNGDGMNDILFVRGNGVRELNFKIYNRWGQVVFETTDMNKGWDGTFKGEFQNLESFAYTLQATFINGETMQKQGNITLLE